MTRIFIVGMVEPLGLLPTFHRQGLGRAILLEVLQQFATFGAKRVLIDAENTNDGLQHLYEMVGFREETRTYKYFRLF